MKPPPRGRIMTKTGIDTASVQAAIIPALGVVPPSNSAAHNSNLRAPPRSAATADATESTQASTRIGASSVVTKNYSPGPAISHSWTIACSRFGSSPSHCGCVAVESKIDVVLKSSNSPFDAAPFVFASSAFTCASLSGLKSRATSIA